ncbi:molybdate transport system permease protein [Psychromicrobium silvestre]|uniref:Molybdate transport system permease protein n=1 Tax=Psychromicrobium silvestre TaxID=1645614 RepID=A0A7Y9LW90_9MICC|nr:ABC transporter permease subunit [Psychromicrobium silvestre]NYE96721.1 molybdate transport system permease protein [Psychromicrobium silvestre]
MPHFIRSTLPRWLWLPAGLALFLCAGPLIALLVKAPWTQLPALLSSPDALQSLVLSLFTACVSTVLCALLGLPLAVILSKLKGFWISLMRGLLLIPLVLSPVVSGIALLYFWGRNGLFGSLLADGGLDVGFSPWAVILVQVFVSLPFFVISALTSLNAVEPEMEMVAATSGAKAGQILRFITVPLALPGILVGSLLAFARSLGEYGATITFAGSIAGRTRTLPLQIELSLNSNQPEAALGISLMLIGIYIIVLLLARVSTGRLLIGNAKEAPR